MQLPTIAIVVGVSQYFQEDVVPLPAAQNDALNFARCIKNWGIPEPDITLLLNADAKKKTIEDIFAQLSMREDPYKILFYFCGHGHRTTSSNVPQSYLFFHDSFVQDNRCINSLSLDSIIKTISRLNAIESYVLIDACYLRINTIVNPKLEEELKGKKTSSKSFFCVLSSGIQESYESEKGQYGYFTEALLKSFCKIRKSECSPTELLQHIHQEMVIEGVPLPEMYNFGNQKISFLSHPDTPALHKEFIYRHEFIAKIQDTKIENRGKWICLVGETGIGKSAIAKHFESEKLKTIYVSMPAASKIPSDPIDHLANSIKAKLNNHFSHSFSSQQLLSQFDSYCSFYIVIIDHLERLNPLQLNRLFEAISQLKTQFLLISNQPLNELIHEEFANILITLEVPSFSYEEGKQLIKMIEPDCSESECEFIYLICQGNPLKMKKIVFSSYQATDCQSVNLEQELKKAIAGIYSCGSYINEQLFMKKFNLHEEILDFLRDIGLISYLENRWIPHSFLCEIVETENLPIDQRATLNYWYEQLDELPDHPQANKYMVLSVKCFGYEEKAEKYLRTAIQTLSSDFSNKENLSYLTDVADIFLSLPHLTETALFLAQILIDCRQFVLAQQLLAKPPVSKGMMIPIQLCKIQNYWKTGELQESIILCSEIIQNAKNSSQSVKGYFHRGVAHFLNGNWNEATSDFRFVYEKAQDKHYMGRAQCMLGSLVGIRGIDVQLGQKYLEAGTRLLAKIKDFMGVWSGWNNLGEIFWKCGEFKASSFYLEKALELTSQLGQETARLETLRNLLQLHLRVSGPLSKKVTDLIVEIEEFDWEQYGLFERVHLLNTLATAYIFRRDSKKALSLLELVFPWTEEKSQYHYYTLSNFALLFQLLGKNEKAEIFIQKAIQLAQKGEDSLAILQMKNDFAICFKDKLISENTDTPLNICFDKIESLKDISL